MIPFFVSHFRINALNTYLEPFLQPFIFACIFHYTMFFVAAKSSDKINHQTINNSNLKDISMYIFDLLNYSHHGCSVLTTNLQHDISKHIQ